jgi:MSHA pilin protein MshC
MCAISSDPRRARPAHGFTVVELIAVMLLVGVLAVVALPRLDGTLGLRGTAWRDQVLAATLQARSLATGHRRLVCLTVATGAVQMAMATANPATSCNTTVPGPDGDARWAVDPASLAVTVSPAGTLYLQPDGRITSDGAGLTAVNATIAIAGETALQITGETGHVR